MSKVPHIKSTSEFSNRVDRFEKGSKNPPLQSSHSKDFLTSCSEETSQGIVACRLSWISHFLGSVLNGLYIVCVLLRSLFKWLLRSKAKSHPISAMLSLEEKKNKMAITFDSSSHSKRFQLLVFDIAMWPEHGAKTFFIELFNKQDEKVLNALADRLRNEFNWDLEKTKVEMPELIFKAFHTKQAEKTLDQQKLTSAVHQFLLEFPDYALTYVETCFETVASPARHFEALGILASHQGRTQNFHVKQVEGKKAKEAIRDALKIYYNKLSQTEKGKLFFICADLDPFNVVDGKLIVSIINKREDSEMIKICRDFPAYSGSKEEFPTFLNHLVTYTRERWLLLKAQILTKFDDIKEQYTMNRDQYFLDLSESKQFKIYQEAYETESDIFKARLEVLAKSRDSTERQVINQRVLNHNPAGSILLFWAYREASIQEMSRGKKNSEDAESIFNKDWSGCVDFVRNRIRDRVDFNRAMEAAQMTTAYQQGAQALLNQLFPLQEGKEE